MSNNELAGLSINDKVQYKDKTYTVLYIYDSGYIEIKESSFKVELVHYSEVNKQADRIKLETY